MTAARSPVLASISEAEWQQQLLDLAHLLGWRHLHVRRSIGRRGHWTTATNLAGWPDLVLWNEHQQRLLFVEVKKEVGRLTPDQREVLASLTRAGQTVHVWRPSDLERVRDELTRPETT